MGRLWTWGVVLVCLVCAGYPALPAQAFPDREAATLTVGDAPQQVIVSPDGRYAYVTNSGDNTVTVIDLFRFKVVGDPISVGEGPYGMVTNSSGTTLYVTNQNDGTVSVVELTGRTVTDTITVGTTPQGMVIAPDDSLLYVTNSSSGTLSVITTSDNTVDQTIALGIGASRVIIEPVQDQLYVSLTTLNEIAVLNRDDLSIATVFGLGTLPVGLATSPDGEFLYVVGSGVQSVSVIKIDDLTLEAQVVTEAAPQDIALTPDGSLAFVTNTSSDSLTIFDAVTYDILADGLTVGSGPGGVAVTPDARYVLVANEGDDAVSVVTESPFITIESLEPSAINGTGSNQSTLTWNSDLAGSYRVEAGGDGSPGSGTLVATGNVEADEQVSTVVPASSLSQGEGTYEIFAHVTGSATGAVGRTSAPLIFDTTPPTVPQDLRTGPGGTAKLTIFWSASTDTGSGVANYRVFFGTAPGVYDDPNSPVDAGNETSVVLSSLDDNTTYYVVVSAVDAAGNESEQSAEVSGTPVAVSGSTSGGGCFIRTVGVDNGGWVWLGFILLIAVPAATFLVMKRERREGTLLVLVCLIGGLGASALLPVSAFGADLNATGISWSVQGGYFVPTGDRVKDAYDGGFMGKFSFIWKNITNFETSVGVGLVQAHGSALDEEGKKISSVDADLLYVPADLNIRYRFQYHPLQTLIPYLGVGFVGAYYDEKLDGGEKSSGWTYGVEGLAGCRVNMLSLTPQGMADFSRTVGAKNAFLFLEGNYSRIDRFGSQNFDLGGLGVMAGVEIVY